LLPPAVEVETKAVLKECIGAATALAELNRAAELIPTPAILIGTLPLLEARASSEIENIVTTTDELFRHLRSDSDADTATKEALRYRHALMEAYTALPKRPIGTRLAESICSRIKDAPMAVRALPGTVLAAAGGKVVYTPPDGEARIRDLLANWERFVHADDELEPLVRLAIAHYQFEAIHPFRDGNGRTGRILNSLFLAHRGLLRVPILSLSRYIIRNRKEYYRRLLDVTRAAAWEPWILYVLRGIEETARWTLDKISAMRDLMTTTAEFVRARKPKIYTREFVEAIFEQPYCRIGTLVEAGIVQRQAASRYLKSLTAIGVLEEHAMGREKLWVNTALLELLTRGGD
jgi:Fic family protein